MTEGQRPQSPFWSRLRSHPAFQSAVVFAGGSWLALQAADVFGLETRTVRLLGVVLVAIFVCLAGYSLFAVLRRDAPSVRAARVPARTVGIVAAVLLALGTGAWFARPYVLPPLRPDAEVIAVLPFNASGPNVDLLGEGLVDLLSANLNEVGVIRTINPRTTLHAYSELARDGGLDLSGQLRVGRNVGAGSVLVGSVVSTGTEVRLTAELISVETGDAIAQVQHSGRPDSVLALVDELSIGLLRDIWRSRARLPTLQVGAITSSSIPAIRAYMRGEQFYRRVEWDSASAAFEEAVAHDSTFALAHFRLGETYGWRETLGSAQARRHSELAVRYADRLPARERALIVAHQLHEQGDVAAIDSFAAYVDRFPDDVAGRYLLADARFHAATVLGLDMKPMLASFEQLHEMDSSFAPSYAHLIDLTFLLGDSAKFGRFIGPFREISQGEADGYEAAGVVRWGPRAEALSLVGEAMGAGRSASNVAVGRLFTAATSRAFADNDIDLVLAALDTLEAASTDNPQLRNQAIGSRALMLGSAGRIRESDSAAAAMRRVSVDLSLNYLISLIISGVAPAGSYAAERAALERAGASPFGAYWQSMQALMTNDAAAAERLIARARTDTTGNILPEMADALAGWLAVVRGDTIGGTRQMKDALLRLGYAPSVRGPTTPLRIVLAMLQTTQPATRAEGIRRIEGTLLHEPATAAFLMIPLAEAYAADGRLDEAALTYRRFIELWQDADPELRPRVDAAQAALERLAGERTG